MYVFLSLIPKRFLSCYVGSGFKVVTLNTAQVRLYTAEADIALGSILEFVGTGLNLDEVFLVFPGTATDNFAFHRGGIAVLSIVLVVGRKCVSDNVSRLIVGVETPLSNIAGHVVETVIVRSIVANHKGCVRKDHPRGSFRRPYRRELQIPILPRWGDGNRSSGCSLQTRGTG